jgi:hypothetical protein
MRNEEIKGLNNCKIGKMGVEKQHVVRRGKNIIFRWGGGINIVFGPKYRPLTYSRGGHAQLFFYVRDRNSAT